MVITTLALTLTLATVFGVYLIAGGLSGLVDRDRWPAILEAFKADPALTFVTGVVAFAIGAVLVIVHNNWADLLAVVITLIGWAALVEGLVLIVAPQRLLAFAGALLAPSTAQRFAVGAILAGTVLLVLGLMGQAG